MKLEETIAKLQTSIDRNQMASVELGEKGAESSYVGAMRVNYGK